MASYTESKKQEVRDIIDKYTGDTLDGYIRNTVKNAALTQMVNGAEAVDVADAVFDCIKENYSGNQTEAMMCQQICPTSILLLLRNEIISALK